MAAAMVCLLVIMLFAGAVARSIMLRHQSTRLDERQVQCFWLAESASLRAIAKSRNDPAYEGEVWQISAQVRGVAVQGVAEIKVEPILNVENRKRIKVEARWPDATVERVLRSKEFSIAVQIDSPGAAL